tara:strand:+ start:11505 stop:11756 length:252 start_codon:yes stop_codon:yes gene_type:complete
MTNVTITKTVKYPGEYTYELSNGHKIRIVRCDVLREWSLFAYDNNDNSYEPCHPFHDTFGDAKASLPEALSNIDKGNISMATL